MKTFWSPPSSFTIWLSQLRDVSETMTVRYFILLSAICVLAGGCAPRDYPAPAGATRGPGLFDWAKKDQELIAEFQQKYAQYEVAKPALPTFARGEFVRRNKTNYEWKGIGVELGLTLGARVKVAGKSGNYRSGSRYRLLGKGGKVLATAESTISRDDQDWGAGVWIDEARQNYLIDDSQGWSCRRFIVLRPGAGAGGAKAKWEVLYVKVPQRWNAANPLSNLHLLGLKDGRVYTEADGRYYAFPIEALERETDLIFTVG